jgi:hypothetical protein
MVQILEKCRLKNPPSAEIINISQLVTDSHPHVVHNAAKRQENNWLSSDLFHKISRQPGFFIFAGKGFESQWLCQTIVLPHGASARRT